MSLWPPSMFVNIENLGWVRLGLGVRKLAQLISLAHCIKLSLTPQDRTLYYDKLVLANGDCVPDPSS